MNLPNPTKIKLLNVFYKKKLYTNIKVHLYVIYSIKIPKLIITFLIFNNII